MNLRKWGITLLSCIIVFAALAYFKVTEIRAAIAFGESFPEHSESVEEAVVQTVNFTPTIRVIGEMVAPQRLDLRNELAGEIAEVNFQSGATIAKGQVLLQLDTSVETANLEAAEARAELAQSVYKRSEDLFRSKAVSKDQLDRAKADLSTSVAEMEALKRTIEKKTLRSPFDGKAGLHDFEVGQFLMDNTFITTLISDKDFIWVDFKVPQFYRRLLPGTELEITTIGHANSRIQGTATVVAENTIIESINRSRTYRAKVPNADNQLTANTMVNVKVPVDDEEALLEIPSVSIQQDPLGQFVFLLVEDKENKGFRANRRQVKVKAIENEKAVIESGVKAGDLIAAAGAFKLHEGLLVFSRKRQEITSGVASDSQPPAIEQDSL
ncbi:MAG: efflux RND transporter periplasmic adaptor subunit [Ketobacter sp.]